MCDVVVVRVKVASHHQQQQGLARLVHDRMCHVEVVRIKG